LTLEASLEVLADEKIIIKKLKKKRRPGVHVNASSPSSAPRRRRHDAKGILGKRMCMHLLPSTNSTYMMMTRGCMHAPLSIKKVMSMKCVCMHPLTIIIKKYSTLRATEVR
jgi:hypothetical protein